VIFDKFALEINTVVQCKPLDVITDNVIIQLMWSNWPRLSKSQLTVYEVSCISKILLIVIIWSMLSLSVCPNVSTLDGLYCNLVLYIFSLKEVIPNETKHIRLIVQDTDYVEVYLLSDFNSDDVLKRHSLNDAFVGSLHFWKGV
jgi:hypothetical protein